MAQVSDFQSTMWTLIRSARAGGETALNALVGKYREPVRRFLRRHGLGDADADDLSQEVFLHVFEDGVLEKADPARGRFRSLLLAVTRHVVQHHREKEGAQKRGAGRRVPLSGDEIIASRERDADFDREWVANLIQVALDRLARENPNYHRALRLILFGQKSHREIAAEMGKTEDEVRNYVSRGKSRLVDAIHEEIRGYSSSNEEYADEVRYLSEFLQK
jgi:RNA polymerase sigma-70 factor (ECF subfamily)